jgi:hypothetical protein
MAVLQLVEKWEQRNCATVLILGSTRRMSRKEDEMRSTLITSSALALVMCSAAAIAQTQQQKAPEASQSSPMPDGKATGGEQRAQQKDEGTKGQKKAEPKSDKGTAQGESKDKSTTGTAQTSPTDKDQGAKARTQAEQRDPGAKGSAQKQPSDKTAKDRGQDRDGKERAQTSPSDQGTRERAQGPKDQGTKERAQTQPGDQRTKDRAQTKPQGQDTKGAAKAPDTGGRIQLSEQQRTNVHQTVLKDRNVNRASNVNFSINVGTRVPRSVRLAALPASVISVVPEFRSYRYVLVDEQIVIVDPNSFEIVEVITASGQTARVERGGSATLVLTPEEKRIILSEIDVRGGSTLALGALTEGADLPRDVEVRTFPTTVVEKVPKVRDFKFVTAENKVAIVDPQGTKVQLVIEAER